MGAQCVPETESCCPKGGACNAMLNTTCCGTGLNQCCHKNSQDCVNDKCVCHKDKICGTGPSPTGIVPCCDPAMTKCCTNAKGGNGHCIPKEFECCASGQGCFSQMQECCGMTCCMTDR